ncbi:MULTISPECIES: GNAT family N-acetyltransferase [unclassified Pseudomonas]|uniref:GNAT family N-acetyltransferase n=1 Tax=unclassified Pseudomonas TaxID=196821 RepID=UPI000D3B1CD4|nr:MULTISPECIES: GNAT family N-acetyltransferase [unclassified Pseudomonas]RAU48533.1 GNAT family N-acetyltransferase [Pseudomonas sp. RIT 409]RAU54207.1 GNAT family N-acetyltransferase [Pseudomonas sp. RIT 412]
MDEVFSNVTLQLMESDSDIKRCFEVMRQLRPQLKSADDLLVCARRQRPEGYRILAALQAGSPVGLAGYRMMTNMIHGHFLYVDDLITTESIRGTGIGALLIRDLKAIAGRAGCNRLVLDTALGNALGQRFYFRQGLLAGGMQFAVDLS